MVCWQSILTIKNSATFFGSLSQHQTKYKTVYWYIQWVHTMGSHIFYRIVLTLKIIY